MPDSGSFEPEQALRAQPEQLALGPDEPLLLCCYGTPHGHLCPQLLPDALKPGWPPMTEALEINSVSASLSEVASLAAVSAG